MKFGLLFISGLLWDEIEMVKWVEVVGFNLVYMVDFFLSNVFV